MAAMAYARDPEDGYIHVVCECGFHSRIVIPNSLMDEEEAEADRTINNHREFHKNSVV